MNSESLDMAPHASSGREGPLLPCQHWTACCPNRDSSTPKQVRDASTTLGMTSSVSSNSSGNCHAEPVDVSSEALAKEEASRRRRYFHLGNTPWRMDLAIGVITRRKHLILYPVSPYGSAEFYGLFPTVRPHESEHPSFPSGRSL